MRNKRVFRLWPFSLNFSFSLWVFLFLSTGGNLNKFLFNPTHTHTHTAKVANQDGPPLSARSAASFIHSGILPRWWRWSNRIFLCFGYKVDWFCVPESKDNSMTKNESMKKFTTSHQVMDWVIKRNAPFLKRKHSNDYVVSIFFISDTQNFCLNRFTRKMEGNKSKLNLKINYFFCSFVHSKDTVWLH